MKKIALLILASVVLFGCTTPNPPQSSVLPSINQTKYLQDASYCEKDSDCLMFNDFCGCDCAIPINKWNIYEAQCKQVSPCPTYTCPQSTAVCKNKKCTEIVSNPSINPKYLQDPQYCEKDLDCGLQETCQTSTDCGLPVPRNIYNIGSVKCQPCDSGCMICNQFIESKSVCKQNKCTLVPAV